MYQKGSFFMLLDFFDKLFALLIVCFPSIFNLKICLVFLGHQTLASVNFLEHHSHIHLQIFNRLASFGWARCIGSLFQWRLHVCLANLLLSIAVNKTRAIQFFYFYLSFPHRRPRELIHSLVEWVVQIEPISYIDHVRPVFIVTRSLILLLKWPIMGNHWHTFA